MGMDMVYVNGARGESSPEIFLYIFGSLHLKIYNFFSEMSIFILQMAIFASKLTILPQNRQFLLKSEEFLLKNHI